MKVAVVFVTIALVAFGSTKVIDKSIIAREVCYDHYGCFGTSRPWTSIHRPLSAVPNTPYEVGTRFILFTRGSQENEQVGYELMPDKDAILKFSDFDASRKTYFIIHGYTDNSRVDWVLITKDLLLQREDVNVITVDWERGASSFFQSYLQVTANSRMAGAMIARMITYLEQKAELNADDIHIISHSIGGHVAGYAGERLLGRINRITAIDPMDLYFGNTDPMVRLDPTDAQFVEVIHSNDARWTNLGLGIAEAIGHVDIYPNGGSKQPGCKDTLGNLITSIIDLVTLNFEGAISTWACSHIRAAHFYVDSIANTDSCPYASFPCSSFSEFEKGNCYQTCSEPGKCAHLGYNAKRQSGASGTYYLRTTDGAKSGSYCKQVVQLQAAVSLTQEQTTGSLSISFRGEDGSTSETFKVANNVKISAGQILQLWVEVPQNILKTPDHRPNLVLRYTRGGLLPIAQPKTLALDSVSFVMIKPDLSSALTGYQGVTLEYATDTVITG